MVTRLVRIGFVGCLALPAGGVVRVQAQRPIDTISPNAVGASPLRVRDPSILNADARVRAKQDSAIAPKSPRRATRLSIGATVFPVAAGVLLFDKMETLGTLLIVGGVLVGPSAGHFYAGRLGFLPYRLAATAAVIGLLASIPEPPPGSIALAAIPLIPISTFIVLDWATADAAARRWNRRHGLNVAVYPLGMDGGAGFTVAVRAGL